MAVAKIGGSLAAESRTVPRGAAVCAYQEALGQPSPTGADKPMSEACKKAADADKVWRGSMVVLGAYSSRLEALASRKETRLLLDLEQRAFRVEPDPRVHALPKQIELKLFTAQSDLLSDKVGTIRFFPDGGSNGGRVTLAAGERKYNVDIDWLTGRVAILD